jgi:hypothetical protein
MLTGASLEPPEAIVKSGVPGATILPGIRKRASSGHADTVLKVSVHERLIYSSRACNLNR